MLRKISWKLPAGAWLILLLLPILVGCERPEPEVVIVTTRGAMLLPPTSPVYGATDRDSLPPTSPVGQVDQTGEQSFGQPYVGTPTPDPVRPGAEGRSYAAHIVGSGETLGYLAQYYDTSIEDLIEINALDDSGVLSVGQVLQVPEEGALFSPSFKIIPDSELVYGPAAKDFDVERFAAEQDGYLSRYQDTVEGSVLSGPEVIELVAARYSVNPRLLLAALEYRTGWVTDADAIDTGYPMGQALSGSEGLYWQLSWAADQLNWGYYGRSEGGMGSFDVGGATRVNFAPDINDGTAGVQYWLAVSNNAYYESWQEEVSEDGFYATYTELFGNPFALSVEPLWPVDLTQPAWQLPWPTGEEWYFTGGPHGGWAPGSAWAALDFVPPGDQLGCYPSDDWVTAMTGGVIARSDHGAVVLDVDGDGYAGTGWAITYMHLETRDRVPVGMVVEPGDRLGHPSCEGGFSNGTHVHISRTYNGRWVAADGPIPFAMGGWVSEGLAREYDGLLINGDTVREACECRDEINAIGAVDSR